MILERAYKIIELVHIFGGMASFNRGRKSKSSLIIIFDCKVTVRCGCQTLKKEWLCKDVQMAYCNDDRDPKEIPRTQFGSGLLPCNSECKNKVSPADSELQFPKFKVPEVITFTCTLLVPILLTSSKLIP